MTDLALGPTPPEVETVEHEPGGHVAGIVTGLMARASETRGELCRLRVVDSREQRRERALSMLHRLQARGEALLEALDLGVQPVGDVLRALAGGDERRLAELGIDVDYAWIDDLVRAMIHGAPFVEVQTMRTHAHRHLRGVGGLDVRAARLPAEDVAGMLLAGMLRDVTHDCGNVRLVVLLDDVRGDVSRPELTAAERDAYVMAVAAVLRRYGIILPTDVPGKDHLLLRASEFLNEVDGLIERLRRSDDGVVTTAPNGDVTFHLVDSFVDKLAIGSDGRRSELRAQGIALKRSGWPTSQALDAASFVGNPINRDIVHVVILDSKHRDRQDEIYALLRALGLVVQERYHNVFFDTERLGPDLVAYALNALLVGQVQSFIRLLDRMAEWNQFDPDEYVGRNYGERIFTEDKDIIEFVIAELARAGLPPEGVALAADIGSGPNFYPAMLLAPHVRDGGAIDLIEYGMVNRSHALGTVLEQQDGRSSGIWEKFEDLMVSRGGARYEGAFRRACDAINVVSGSIFALPRNRYDVISSYFVSESITVSRREFRLAIRSLASCVKRGGVLVVAHMVGSREWYAGEDNHFPSVHLSVDDIAEAYRDADLPFTLHPVGGEARDKARDGYHGMVVVVARRP